MDISLISIGNSKGIRLSKTILEKSQIIIKPVAEPRKGWDLKFKKMHDNGDDKLFIGDVFKDEDFEEWT